MHPFARDTSANSARTYILWNSGYIYSNRARSTEGNGDFP